jgi:hypothetical protein
LKVPHPPTGELPIVPYQGGALIAAPQIVLVTWDEDSRAQMEADVQWLIDTSYLSTVAAEYGIGNMTLLAAPHLPSPAPNDASGIVVAMPSLFASNALPAFDASNIYVFLLPASGEEAVQ